MSLKISNPILRLQQILCFKNRKLTCDIVLLIKVKFSSNLKKKKGMCLLQVTKVTLPISQLK